MTNIITRYFDSAAKAREVKFELVHRQRFSTRIIDLYDQPKGLVKALTAAHVQEDTAKAYEKRMAKGGAVLLVRAGYRPLAVAKTTRQITAGMGAADMGDLVEEVFVKEDKRPLLSILDNHPHMLLRPRDPDSTNYHMADWPIPLISRRKPFTGSVIKPHAHMANWPIPLISRRKPFTGSIIARHGRMANFPIPLISRRKPYTESIIPRHARMANFPIPLISRRKPFTGSIFPRHQRMATWPFPLLINGKTGTNALMPGGPRMANFPIGLLSDRKPFTGSIIPRHARMANFPIPLISRRKPYTGSVIEPHAHMADFPLPLITRRSETASPSGGKGFSFSKMLGIPTIIRR